MSDLGGFSMLELFAAEAESQVGVLDDGLLSLEREPLTAARLQELMRAAHSLKGAARLVGIPSVEKVAHVMEDFFLSAQRQGLSLEASQADALLSAVDLIREVACISTETALQAWESTHEARIEGTLETVRELTRSPAPAAPVVAVSPPPSVGQTVSSPLPSPLRGETLESEPPRPTTPVPRVTPLPAVRLPEDERRRERAVRVDSQKLAVLMGLAGEVRVASRWAPGQSSQLVRLKRAQLRLSSLLAQLLEELPNEAGGRLQVALNLATETSAQVSTFLHDLDAYDRRMFSLSDRLHEEVLSCQMRPFSEGTQGLERMVRDLSRLRGKQVRLLLGGLDTPVDRDILERMEAPLSHLLRNAVDHGMEPPEQRQWSGKPAEGQIRLQARHRSGMLTITVEDDGRGIDVEEIRRVVTSRGLTPTDVASKLSDQELAEFLFLPGFSTRDHTDEISGRGVGLDVVRTAISEMGGQIATTTTAGKGTRFECQLPVTLSVIRCLLFEVSGEPYAMPLSRLDGVARLRLVQVIERSGRPHIPWGEGFVPLIEGAQALQVSGSAPAQGIIDVVILGRQGRAVALQVDRLLGEESLVVQALDPRLGKLQHVSAGAILENGDPVLILDVDDLAQTCEKLATQAGSGDALKAPVPEKGHKILVVDDSITVREVERQLLENQGYQVDVAVDGMDAWNALRARSYDLVVTDVDMPRMDGIKLVELIRSDPQLKPLPVIIVSYKDREEDRLRGLEVGADYYLTKGSFKDDSFVSAVEALLGVRSS